jgi:two-component system, NtrC family, response regulator HydG
MEVLMSPPDRTESRKDAPLPTFLVVDDERVILDVMKEIAQKAGFQVITCGGGREALEHLQTHHADVAAVDLRMPDVGGMDVLRAIRDRDPDCQVVLMTGQATIESAVEAVKLGAVDYLTKPLDFRRVKQLLSTVRDNTLKRQRLFEAEQQAAKNAEFCGMIGRGPAMLELFGLIQRLAPHVRTALITGETGTGKELVARALYQTGPRKDKRFVVINSSAIVSSLFESELFGHTRGAFTGASDNKPGLFEYAHGGTIFLDEIGELPLPVQAKLLRVLETGEVQRVGTMEPRRVDVHVLAATNRDLSAEVAAGNFRADLLYRLNVVEVRVPALRDRREDIPYLVAAFVRESATRLGKRLTGLTPSAERALNMSSAGWPGNVRELRNVIERACILADGEFVTERELAQSKPVAAPAPAPNPTNTLATKPDAGTAAGPQEGSLSLLEREHILRVMESVKGNKVSAARILGLDRRALYRRLERYGIGTIERRGKSKH